MIDGIFMSRDAPAQGIAGNRGGNREAIADAGLNLSAFLVVVPSHELQQRELLTGVVEAIDLRKCLEPSLSTLLPHDALRSPRGERIVEALVRGSERFFGLVGQSCVVKACQIAHAVIGGGRHDPRIAAIGQRVSKTIVVLEDE